MRELGALAILCLVIKGRYLPGHWIVETLPYVYIILIYNTSSLENNDNTKIANNFEVASNFKLNTIADVEQKIIDVSNAIIPYITYDSVNDELVVTKDMNLH